MCEHEIVRTRNPNYVGSTAMITHSRMLSVVLSIVTTSFALSPVAAQRGNATHQTPPDVAATTTDDALRQNFVAEHEIGRRFRIDPSDLPAQGDHILVADQDGVWRVPHVLGALRAGRAENQRVEQVPPADRKPVAGAYGAE